MKSGKKPKHIYFFVGTTAEFIKILPVLKELKSRKISFKLITSGQGKILYRDFVGFMDQIKADIELSYKGDRSSVMNFIHWSIVTLLQGITKLKSEFSGKEKQTTFLIVHGDTVSSLIGSLIAKIYGLTLVHIESGLRSFNFLEPFPEELTRFLISRLADIHFCPNKWSLDNLRQVHSTKVNTFQNSLIDIFKDTTKYNSKTYIRIPCKHYFVLVIHRQEHVLFNKNISKDVLQLILKNKGKIGCVLIKHDLTSQLLQSINITDSDLKKYHVVTVPRLPYYKFMNLVFNAEFFITDGGSNQEEAYYMGKPCLILRKHTERVEGLKKNAVLSRMEENTILNFLNNPGKFKRKPVKNNLSPSKIIVDYLYE